MHQQRTPHSPLHGDGPAQVDLQQYLRFAVADGIYAVPIAAVREILEVAPSTALPMMPSFVRGVMNLRGAVVPVIDLAARFGLPPTQPGRRACIVVVEVLSLDDDGTAPQVLGLLVDAVHEVLEADAATLEETPPLGTRIAPQYISGIARSRQAMVSVLDLPRALDNAELAQLIEHAVQH
jgi:purine-binding chemotaxis protein CheW